MQINALPSVEHLMRARGALRELRAAATNAAQSQAGRRD